MTKKHGQRPSSTKKLGMSRLKLLTKKHGLRLSSKKYALSAVKFKIKNEVKEVLTSVELMPFLRV